MLSFFGTFGSKPQPSPHVMYIASSSAQVTGRLSLPAALRTIVPTGAQIIFSITGLGGQGGPADAAEQIKMQSASFRIKEFIPACRDSDILVLDL
jgi:hypothetical protein